MTSGKKNNVDPIQPIPVTPAPIAAATILVDYNKTARDYPRDTCTHELFERQAAITPNAVAAEFGNEQFSYSELNNRANRLAAYLRSLGVAPGVFVGLSVERSCAAIVAILGILKAGGVYVPLDPEYPVERLAFMLDDTEAPVVVSQESLVLRLPKTGAQIVCLDRDWQLIEKYPAENIASGANASNLAYVIYTSGSTGKPKGVQVTHRAINRLVCNTDYVDIRPEDRFAQVSVMSFDAATFEIWGALLNGARVVGVPRELSLSPKEFTNFLRERGITVLFLTTALFNQTARNVSDAFKSLRYVLFGGEAVDPKPVRAVLQMGPPEHLLHVYGPTEVTTFSTWHPVVEVEESATTIPIGRPIANTTAYVLDEKFQALPSGVTGELYLGGDGVAQGYLKREELTAERFINDPFCSTPEARLYRTGDWVRCRSDGVIEFVGRRDHQVKIRGYRIELGEIEAALMKLPQIRDAIVTVREDIPGDRRVIAYIVPAVEVKSGLIDIRGQLRQHLPDFMIPSAFVVLECLPLTPNGKVDRAALPAPKGERQATGDLLVVPRNELERSIATVWQEMLQLQEVGINDNFFDLGGHSLLLVKTHALLCDRLGFRLKVIDLFTYPTISTLAEHLAKPYGTGKTETKRVTRAFKSNDVRQCDSIAIVGMAGRFPGARNVDEFWDNLCAGREGVRFFSHEEIDPSVPETIRSDPNYVRARGVIDDCDKFDASFFGIGPVEAQIMDPQQRIMLELAWSALENAGYAPSQFPGLIGIYAGMNWNRYRAHCVAAHPEVIERFGEFNTALANEYDFLTTRISYKLNLRGPSVNVSTACSTSLVAIAQACQALLNYECDLALAGGVSVTVPVNAGYLHQDGSMLSADGHCRAFDASSTGTTFNDGAGLVVLRRMDDAVKDSDRIYAIVRGFAVNNDGSDKVSFTAPSVNGQADVIRSAVEHAGVDASTIGLIEAHGTATPLGDPIEVAALKRVFTTEKMQDNRCVLGAVKSSIGHVVHAAGVAGFIKAVLAVEQGKIPPTLFFAKPNPRLELENSPFYINTTLEDWKTSDHPRRAGVSSFGVGGTNAHVIVEQPPQIVGPAPSGLPRVICLSAKSDEALDRQIENLKRALTGSDKPEHLDAVAYTLQCGREAMSHRAAWAVHSIADAVDALADKHRTLRARASDKRIAFMFTGQGAQRANMGRRLYEKDAFFRQCFDQGAELVQASTGLDLRVAIFSDLKTNTYDIDQTSLAQPALFLLEYSLARTLENIGVVPSILLGHSIGEFVAATLAGIFTLEDALDVVAKRGEAMQAMPGGSMLTVYCGEEQISPLLRDGVAIAALNAPELSVLSGLDNAVNTLAAELDKQGIRNKKLRTSHAFHSSMMDPAVDVMRKVLADVNLSKPTRKIISTVTGKPLTDTEATDPDYWSRQLRETVRFADALDSLAGTGDHLLLEVGPGGTLTTLALQHPRADRWSAHAVLPSCGVQDGAELEVWAASGFCWAHGAPIDWKQHWRDVEPRRVTLPTYPFARTRYWLDAHPLREQGVAPVQISSSNVQSTELGPNTMNDTNLQDAIRQKIIGVIDETTGVDIADAEPTTLFVELGFDSLALTQIAIQLKQAFKVDITFRQMMEKYRSLETLAAFLDTTVPAESPAARPSSVPAAAGGTVFPPGAPAFGVAASGTLIEQVIQQQMQMMAQQLALLRGLPSAAVEQASGVTSTPVVPVAQAAGQAPTPRPGKTAAADDEAPTGLAKYDVKKAFGAIARIHTDGAESITERQRVRLNTFMRRYIARTKLSKEYTQTHRSHLADPRVVNGFRPLLKEIIYQIVIGRSKGSRLWDLDGNEYVDTLNGFGMNLFGWQPPFVADAIKKQIEDGYEIGPQHPLAGEVAKLICELTGFDRAGLCNTGSEAVMGAVRVARTVTGRSTIVLFTGSYHGIFDEVIVRGTKKLRAFPAAPGIMPNTAQNVLVLDYGTAESMEIIKSRASEIAAVLVEPVQSRRPDFQPREFLHELREVTQNAGALLILDEVVTGFRCHPGGIQSLFGVRADLCTYGKVVGGGFPIGIIAGKREFMDALDGGSWQYGDDSIPTVGVTYFAGTFVRHPLALAAAKAVLNHLKSAGPELQETLTRSTAEMVDELNGFCREVGAPVRVKSFASVWKTVFTEEHPLQDLLFAMMRSRGIHMLDNFPCFFTTAHSAADIALIKKAFKESIIELQEADFLPRREHVAANVLDASKPPVIGARLGKDPDGNPAWYVPNPESPGKYMRFSS